MACRVFCESEPEPGDFLHEVLVGEHELLLFSEGLQLFGSQQLAAGVLKLPL